MPANFTSSLCGYRPNGNPNTSDNSDKLSRRLGQALFEELGVDPSQVGGSDPGAELEKAIIDDLTPRRPDLDIRRSRAVTDFEQYKHLGVWPKFRNGYEPAKPKLDQLIGLAALLPPSREAKKLQSALQRAGAQIEIQDEIAALLKANMPEESFLKVDITVGSPPAQDPQLMHIGLSSKWSLRTDRAQDCISQGSKLASQRRGVMPHFAVITIEPRPAMLKILADGSGAIDCVYHLDLPALTRAISAERAKESPMWSPGLTFDRLVQQRRLRDYDELTQEVAAIR